MTGLSTITSQRLAQLLTVATGVSGVWITPEIRLFQNDITPGLATVVADLTEADFDGYVAVESEDPGEAVYNGDGSVTINWQSCQFSHDGGAVGNTIYGYYAAAAGGPGTDPLLFAVRFPEPIGMAAIGNAIIVVPGVRIVNPLAVE